MTIVFHGLCDSIYEACFLLPTFAACVQGVELTHSNLAYQKQNLGYFCPIKAGDRTLSLLPPWHIYERAAAYYVFSRAGSQVNSLIGTPLDWDADGLLTLPSQQQLV